MAQPNFKFFDTVKAQNGYSKKFDVNVTTYKLLMIKSEFADAANILTALEAAFDEVFNTVLGQDRSTKLYRIVFNTPALEQPISTLVLPGFSYTTHTFLSKIESVLLSNTEILTSDPLDLQIICRNLSAEEAAQRLRLQQQSKP